MPDELVPTADNCTPKTLQLIEILKRFGENETAKGNFHGIILVERRITAVAIAELIKRTPSLHFLKCEAVVGHSASDWQGMHHKLQEMLLTRFKKRRINLVVATSVLEEGLDVSPCNVVVRADPVQRHLSFVQSKGRARHIDSRFILMIQKDDEKQRASLLKLLNEDSKMREWLKIRSVEETDVLKNGMTADSPEIPEDEEEFEDVYDEVPSTGARLYPSDSASLLDRYVAAIRGADVHAAGKPQYDIIEEDEPPMGKTFECKIYMPGNAKVRSFTSGIYKSKRKARRMAAFAACRVLRDLGEIDEHLMPKTVPRYETELAIERDERTGKRIAVRSDSRMYMGKLSDAFSGTKNQPIPQFGSGKVLKFCTVLPLDKVDGPEPKVPVSVCAASIVQHI